MTPLSRRDFLAAGVAAGAAVSLTGLATAERSPALEARRLVKAYLEAYSTWDATSHAYTWSVESGRPKREWLPLEEAVNEASQRVYRLRGELIALILAATGRHPLAGSTQDHSQTDLDTWPAAAISLDGVLWVVHQEENGEPGEMGLTHAVTRDVVSVG